MDINDPRLRLLTVKQNNPSIRTATAPAIRPMIFKNPSAPAPRPGVPTQQDQSIVPVRGAAFDNTPTPVQAPQIAQVKQPQSFLDWTADSLSAPFKPFAEGLTELATNKNSNAVDQINANNDATDKTLQMYHDQFAAGKMSKVAYSRAIQQAVSEYGQSSKDLAEVNNNVDKSKFLGSAAQVAAAPFVGAGMGAETLLGKAAQEALLGAGMGALNEFSSEANPTLKGLVTNEAIGGATGGVIPVLGSVFGRLKGLISGAPKPAQDIISAIAGTTESKAVSKILTNVAPNADPATIADFSKYLASEKDPKAIASVVDSLKNDAPQPSTPSPADNTPAYQRGYGPANQPVGNPEIASTPSPVDPAQEAYLAEQSGARAAGSQEGQTYQAGLDPSNPVDNIPAYQRAGKELPSETADAARVDEIKKQLGVMPSTEQVQSVLFNMKKKFAEEVRANPGMANDLRQKYEDNIKSLQGTLDIRGQLEQEASTLTPRPRPEIPAESAPASQAQKIEQAVEQQPPQNGTVATDTAPNGAQVIKNEATPVAGEVAAPVNQAADAAAKGLETSPPEVQTAAQQVMDSLSTAADAYKSADKIRSTEKGARIGAGKSAYEAAGGGAEGLHAKLGSLKGKYSESGFQPIEGTPEVKKALMDNIEQSGKRDFEKLNTQVALGKIFGDVGGKPTPYDIRMLREHFGSDFADTVQAAVDKSGTSWQEKVAAVASTPKAAMATADLSAPLRQGAVLGSRFPKEWAQAAAESVKYFGSPKAYETAMQEISARPSYELMRKAKLAVDGADGITGTEEQFMSSLLETDVAKKLLVGHVTAASDRGYTGFLTKLRADVFDKVLSSSKAAGVELDDKALASLGTFINSASGRGNLGSLEQHAGLLSKALFSPRLWKSRLDLLNPIYYAKLSGPARKLALQSSASFATAAGTVLGIASAAGATVVWDPRSADFAKIKVGNTRYDILGGLQQNIRLGAQLITGEKIDSSTGDVQTLGPDRGFGKPSRLDILMQFFQNKENPLLGYASKVLQGTDPAGNPIDPLAEAGKLFVPLNAQSVVDTYNDTGNLAQAAAMNVPGIFGAGVQTYGNVATKNQGTGANGQPVFKGKIEPNMVTDKNGQVILDSKGKPVSVKFPDKATDLQKTALLDERRTSALAEQYRNKLAPEDQALLKLQPKQLTGYVKDGKITKEQYNHIEQYQQDIKNLDGVEVPDGAKSTGAKQFFEKYNSMTKDNQKAYLAGPPDDNAKAVAASLNKERAKGLSEYKPSNELSKAYADYENDINSHSDYTDIDLRNKAKAFQVNATKLNYNTQTKDIFQEGGSSDLKELMGEGKVKKEDMDAAIQLDNELYTSGLADSLKFTKKFRSAYGYGTPAGSGSGSGSGGSGGKASTSASLAALLPTFSKGGQKPEFSSKPRSGGAPAPVSFRAPAGVIPGDGSSRVTIAPYRTSTITRLRKSVAG